MSPDAGKDNIGAGANQGGGRVIEFIQSLPLWAIKTLALVLGMALAVGAGLLMARWLIKLRAKLPPPE